MTKEEYQAIYDAKYAHLREKLPKVQDLCYRYGYNDMAKDESAMEVLLTIDLIFIPVRSDGSSTHTSFLR